MNPNQKPTPEKPFVEFYRKALSAPDPLEIRVMYHAKPSWKRHGEGRTNVRITRQLDGSLYIIASEAPVNPDGSERGTKEVYFTLAKEVVDLIKKF